MPQWARPAFRHCRAKTRHNTALFRGRRVMTPFHLYMAQRLSALVMAPFVLVHLGVMIYAIQGGLTAAEILGRTQGSLFWFLFYGMFVIAVALHAALGLRVILAEWAGLRGGVLNGVSTAIGLGLLGLGAHAVWAVTAGGGA
ncbi:MAG: succinate dehydrogenase [Roseinatronobacter sp.]|nr:succinate dehydrogenase [Roseinatronobacter sp.]